MQIYNLTRDQVKMLDKLWSFETMSEIEAFKKNLPSFLQQQVDTLMLLIQLQMIDDELDETGDLDLAQHMLASLIEKNY